MKVIFRDQLNQGREPALNTNGDGKKGRRFRDLRGVGHHNWGRERE